MVDVVTLECELDWVGLACWSTALMYVHILTFPGFPPRIRTTEALRRSTSGSWTSCVAMFEMNGSLYTPVKWKVR